MALLDFNDPDQAGLLGIAASLLRSGGASPLPIGLGDALGRAVPEGFGAAQSTAANNAKMKLQNAQMGEYQSIADWRKAEAAKLQAQLEQQKSIGAAYTALLNQSQQGGAAPPSSPESGAAVQGMTGIPSYAIGGQPQNGQAQNGQAPNRLFDPTFYGQLAGIHAQYGDQEGSLKYTNMAREMKLLQYQGIHTVDDGQVHHIFQGNQEIGQVQNKIGPDKILDAVFKVADSAAKNAQTGYDTGSYPGAVSMTVGPNGEVSAQFGGARTGTTVGGAPQVPPGGARTPVQGNGAAPGAPRGNFGGVVSPKASDEARVKAVSQQGEQLIKDYDSLQQIPQGIAALDNGLKLAGSAIPFQGSRAEQKLAIAKFFNNNLGLNLDAKSVANAETLRSALFQPLMANLKKMDANPTERQQAAMKEALGSLETDPGALPRVMLIYREAMVARLQQHNQHVGQAQKSGYPFLFDPSFKVPDAPQASPPRPAMSRDDLKKKYGLQ